MLKYVPDITRERNEGVKPMIHSYTTDIDRKDII